MIQILKKQKYSIKFYIINFTKEKNLKKQKLQTKENVWLYKRKNTKYHEKNKNYTKEGWNKRKKYKDKVGI